jgi:hypothetical protein
MTLNFLRRLFIIPPSASIPFLRLRPLFRNIVSCLRRHAESGPALPDLAAARWKLCLNVLTLVPYVPIFIQTVGCSFFTRIISDGCPRSQPISEEIFRAEDLMTMLCLSVDLALSIALFGPYPAHDI